MSESDKAGGTGREQRPKTALLENNTPAYVGVGVLLPGKDENKMRKKEMFAKAKHWGEKLHFCESEQMTVY